MNALQVYTVSFALAALAAVGPCGWAANPSSGEPSIKQMKVNGAELTYQEQGRGPPVVFVHGAVGDYRAWDGERDAIARDHHFIALTLRYHGTAPWPDDGKTFSFPRESEDIADFIKELNEGPVDLVSWSLSGPLALFVATEHPELVRAMFLYEPAASPTVDPAEVKAVTEARIAMGGPNWGAILKTEDSAEVTKLLLGRVNGQPDYFYGLPPNKQAIFLDNARTIPLIYSDKPPQVTCEQLKQLKMPVTVARGEDTIPFWKITSNAVAHCIPGAHLVVLPNDRHMAPVDDPDAVSAAVLASLSDK